MRKPELRYWVLWLFLLGILIIVFLQVVSGYNINRLTQGNRSLLNELRVQNNLRQLQSGIITVESDIRGAVITSDTESLIQTRREIDSIRSRLRHVQALFKGPVSLQDLKQLESLVTQKLKFSSEIVDAYFNQGKPAAENLIRTKRGVYLRDSIVAILSRIDENRQANLIQITAANETSGRTARLWGVVITIVALLAVVLAFLYTVAQGRQQQKIIALLNESDKRNREVAVMKEQFLANMSHEIRTPMNAILGFTNLLRRTGLNGDQVKYVQNIHSASENLLALVNDILDLSKIEAGMMHLEEVRFSIQGLVSSVTAMFAEKVNEKKLDFEVRVESNVPDVLQGDAVRLTQILVNLISNAVKFTEEGTIRLHISVVDQNEKRVRLQFRVSDTGIGIAPEKQQAIFERFQQAETETTRRFGGSGLGLAIVKQLVDLQKGTIRLQSEIHTGTEFIVELEYKLPDLEQLFSEAMAAESEPVSLKKIKVLIAEDNAMNQQLIAHLMKGWSIDHTIVPNGKEAVEALQRNAYSLVLMDIQMPEMDGYTATTYIRKDLKSEIPIIAMTAHAMAGEKEKCLELGMNDYVSKPLKETVLYNVISKHAHESRGATEEHIDLNYLGALSGGDAEFERQILEQFVIQVPQELGALGEAIENKDHDAIRRVAHSMKSTVGYVGLADTLHPPLDRMEEDASNEMDRDWSEDFGFIKGKCYAAIEEIQTRFNIN